MTSPRPTTPPAAARQPRIEVSCCGGGCSTSPAPASARPAATRQAGPASRDHDHDHGAAGHDHGHDHGGVPAGHAGDQHGGHDGHDHGALPGWGRLAAALLLALAAELLHLLGPDTTAWRIAGMAVAAVAIVLAGLGIYRSGLRSLLRGQLGISALMAVAVTGVGPR